MEKNLKRYKEKTLYCLIEDREERCIMSGFIYINIRRCNVCMLYACHSKNPIKFQRKFLNEKRKERKRKIKKKRMVYMWFDSR